MITAYIKERKKSKNKFENIKIKFKYIVNKIDIENIEDKTIYYLPIFKENKISKHKTRKLTNKVVKMLDKIWTNRIVLSEYLEQNELFKNYLYSSNINILNGRILFKQLYNKIIEYILNIKKEEIQNSEIWITVNDFTIINKEIIIDIGKRVKRLNIVTNNIDKCKDIESYLYNEYGIVLNVSNNKKLALLKAKIILNIDFPEEIMNKYKINTKAIIINMLEKIEIKSKKFSGININYYNIQIPKQYKLEDFRDETSYESIIYNMNFNEIQERLNKDKIKIKYLIGNRGIINKREFT